MKFEEKEKSFDPEVVYKGQPNPTKFNERKTKECSG